MADITFNPVSGVPFSGGLLMKDCTGTGAVYAPTAMDVAGFIPVLSLNGVSATGPGLMLDNQGVRNNHSLVVTTSAGVSGGVVHLQGSQDGVNWVASTVASPGLGFTGTGTTGLPITTSTANTTFIGQAQLVPYRFLRAYITTVITGGTIIAYVASAG
jgi:hypothetical protein